MAISEALKAESDSCCDRRLSKGSVERESAQRSPDAPVSPDLCKSITGINVFVSAVDAGGESRAEQSSHY